MKKDSTTSAFDTKLAEFRRQIDALDDKLFALLIERIGIVSQVGKLKRETVPDRCPIRAGREAEMVRRVIKKFEGSGFSPAAAAAIWRTLIGASTAVEGTLKISVFAPDQDKDLYWLAREYFGPFIPVTRQPLVQRVIGDVVDGKASIGILPMPRDPDNAPWWTSLLQPGSDALKIFAQIPFVHYGTPERNAASGLAFAQLEPEPSGDDRSLLVFEAAADVSQSRLQTAFTAAKLETSWINVATLNPDSRHHLIEFKGFFTPDGAEIKSALAALEGAVRKTTFLGAYAVPIILSQQETVPHAAGAKK